MNHIIHHDHQIFMENSSLGSKTSSNADQAYVGTDVAKVN
jgi:hypothetical protein